MSEGQRVDRFYEKEAKQRPEYWECVGCGLLSDIPIKGKIIEVKLSSLGIRVARVECATCESMIAENSNWMGSNQLGR